MFRDGLAARGIEELPEHLVTSIDPTARMARLASGDTLAVRPVRWHPGAPRARAARGFWPGGRRLGAGRPGQPSDRDFPTCTPSATSAPGPRTVPKAGIFAEAAARVVADDITAEISGEDPPAPYEGSGVCYAEFGGGLVGKVDVNFLRGESPAAERHDPSLEYAAEKAEFGATRRARWFGS